jgi:acetyltransferase-like isoleucine patch superfamily enzyme
MSKAMRALRICVLAVVAVLPSSIKLILFRKLFHYKIGENVSIGLSLIDARKVEIEDGARIGHFNVVRNLPNLIIDNRASIGQWNWITCGDFFTSGVSEIEPPDVQGLFLGAHAALTSRHYVDCAGGVFIGAFTTVAGVRSAILTHQINFEGRQECKAVTIGDYCYIGSNARFVPGASVGDRCVVGMGALVAGALPENDTLYVGVPARPVRDVGDGEYFHRTVGRAR